MERFNLFEAVLPEREDARPDGFRRVELQIGPLIGAVGLGATVHDIPPGQCIYPYHWDGEITA